MGSGVPNDPSPPTPSRTSQRVMRVRVSGLEYVTTNVVWLSDGLWIATTLPTLLLNKDY